MVFEIRVLIFLFLFGWLLLGGREKEKVNGVFEICGRDYNYNGSVVYMC